MKRIIPYEGTEPYIFISYSHKDSMKAMPVFYEMQRRGYRIWYDEGITPGKEWDAFIADHIEKCTLFLALISSNYIMSDNCKDELNWVRELKKPRLLVYLEEVKLPGSMAMRLGRLQAIYLQAYSDQEQFYEKLSTAEGIRVCRGKLPASADIQKDVEIKRVERDQRAAEQGDINAQTRLGVYYYFGQGVPQDYKKAVKWYTKAAEQGDATAQRSLGICYYFGQGVLLDYKTAVYWYVKAAKQGDAQAQSRLGECYQLGYGVSQDYTKAVEWYTRAVEQGDVTAQNSLGVCYFYGHGVSQDYKKAVEWYTRAAEKGDAKAQYNLGACYYFGYGVSSNYKKAVEWYTKSAEQGYSEAKSKLEQLRQTRR